MMSRRVVLVLAVIAALGVMTDYTEGNLLPVFPGAEGFGTTTVAGRGGSLLAVTNLNDVGTGSLRAAIAATGPRIVVFEVSGTISLTSHLEIKNPFVTIAGQTAPSPGITLKGAGISVQTHDVLIQHLRIRVGDDSSGPKPENRDGIQVLGPAYNVVVDHCSISWAVDENADSWFGPRDVTVSHCIISEGLNASIHPKGPHSKGFLVGQSTQKLSLIGNLLAHNADRNPFIKDGATVLLINNLLYNWMSTSGTELGSSDTDPAALAASIVGNLYARGPNTPTQAYAIRVSGGADLGTQLYKDDNTVEGVDEYLQEVSFGPLVATPPIWTSPLTVLSSNTVESLVLATVGARPIDHDTVDERIVIETRARSGQIIDSQRQVGGWPDLAVNTHVLIPPSNPNADEDANGYTNLEEWLHGFAAEVEGRTALPTALLVASPTTIDLGKSTTLTWSTTHAALVNVDQGVGPVASSGTVTVSPTTTTTYTLTARNAAGAVAQAVTVVVVPPPNQPPVLALIGNKVVAACNLLEFTISASDPDSNSLIYSATNLPAGATFTGLTFSWKPGLNQVGTHQVTFSVSDGIAEDSEVVTITVKKTKKSGKKCR